MKSIIAIILLLVSPLISNESEGDYVKIYLNLSGGAGPQTFHSLLGENNSLTTTGYHNDISATIYFDQIEKDTKKKLFKKISKKQRKLVEGMSEFTLSVKGYIPWIGLVPDEFSFSKTDNIEHLYTTWTVLGLDLFFGGFDIGLTGLYLDDKDIFEKGQFKVRPSLGLWLGYKGISLTKTFPVSLDVFYSWRHLYPTMKFYDDLEFSKITTEPSVTINLRIPVKVSTDKLMN